MSGQMGRHFLLLLYLSVIVAPLPGLADTTAVQPLATSDQNVFIQLHTLPSPGEARAVGPGSVSLDWRFDLANQAHIEEPSGDERIVLDSESWRLGLQADWGLGDRLSVGLLLPLVWHHGGVLDRPIRAWHDLVGVSNARRRQFQDGELELAYFRDGIELQALRESSAGIGDLRLQADWRLREARPGSRSLVLRPGLKLPSGSTDRLHGSGGLDLSLQLMSTDLESLTAWNATLAWMIGGLWLGGSEVLEARRRDFVAVGSLSVSRPFGRVRLLLQLDAHGPFYRSELDALGRAAVQLAGGIRFRRSDGGWLDLALIENLVTDPTPDFGLQLRWQQPVRRWPTPAASRSP
jgi:hypothetical protein